MKLIRNSSYNKFGQINTTFNESLTIKPNSKIALDSANFQHIYNSLQITDDNKTITISYNGIVKTVNLAVRVIEASRDNIESFISELNILFNENIELNDDTKGMMWNLDSTSTYDQFNKIKSYGRFFINLIKSPFNYLNDDYNLIEMAMSGSNNQLNRILSASIDTVVGDTTAKLVSKYPFNQGFGEIKMKFYDIDNGAPALSGGTGEIFRVFLIDEGKYPDWRNNNALTSSDYEYSISVWNDGANNFEYYYNKRESVDIYTPKLVINRTTGGANNDKIALVKENGYIKGKLYNTSNDGYEFFSDKYDYFDIDSLDYKKKLVMGITMKQGCRVVNLSQTQNPFNDSYNTNHSIFKLSEQQYDYVNKFPSELYQNKDSVDIDIVFNKNITDYLGYDDSTLSGSILNKLEFQGDTLFDGLIYQNEYIIELLNLDINSFDSLTKGKRNILKIINAPDNTQYRGRSVIKYEASNLNFIDIKNTYEIEISNLNLRILRNDLEPINTAGLSSISIVIQEQN